MPTLHFSSGAQAELGQRNTFPSRSLGTRFKEGAQGAPYVWLYRCIAMGDHGSQFLGEGVGASEGTGPLSPAPSSQSLMPRLRAVQGLDLFLGQAEAAVPLLVGFQGLAELVFPEVGPQGLGDVEFGVG